MSSLMAHLRAGGFNNDSIAVCLCALAAAILQAYVIWQGARTISRKDRSTALLTVLDTVLSCADKVFGLAGASYGYSEQLPASVAPLSTSEVAENREQLAKGGWPWCRRSEVSSPTNAGCPGCLAFGHPG